MKGLQVSEFHNCILIVALLVNKSLGCLTIRHTQLFFFITRKTGFILQFFRGLEGLRDLTFSHVRPLRGLIFTILNCKSQKATLFVCCCFFLPGLTPESNVTWWGHVSPKNFHLRQFCSIELYWMSECNETDEVNAWYKHACWVI